MKTFDLSIHDFIEWFRCCIISIETSAKVSASLTFDEILIIQSIDSQIWFRQTERLVHYLRQISIQIVSPKNGVTFLKRPSSSRRTFFAAGPSLPPGKEAKRPSSDCCRPFFRLSCTLIQSTSCSTVMRTLSGSSIVVAVPPSGGNADSILIAVVAMFIRVEDDNGSKFHGD
jgi:hypothetical protein